MSLSERRLKSVRFSGSDDYSDCSCKSPDATESETRQRQNSSILRKKENLRPPSGESLESHESVFEDDLTSEKIIRPSINKPGGKREHLEKLPPTNTGRTKDLVASIPNTNTVPERIKNPVISDIPVFEPEPDLSVSESDSSSDSTEEPPIIERYIESKHRNYDIEPAILEPSSHSGTYFIDVIRHKPKGVNRSTNVQPLNSNCYKLTDSGQNIYGERTSGSSYPITKGLNSTINNNNISNYQTHNMDVNAQLNSWSRHHEKQQLQDLNNRFAVHLQHVKSLRESSNQVDSTSFITSVKILEEEIVNIRNMYEKELDALRLLHEDVSKEKNHHKMHADKHAQVAQQLQDRLSAEVDKYRRQLDDYNILQRAMALKESELQEARMAIKAPIDDLDHLRREHENLLREFDTFKRRWDHEQRCRQEAEEKVEQLRKQLDFQTQLNTKQGHEMKSRLDVAANTILSLEAKIRDLSKSDNSLAENLRRVRDAAEAEFLKYREDSEMEFSTNLHTLRIQIENDGKQLEEYQKENVRLNGLVDESNSKLAQVQGQVTGLLHEKNAAEEALSLDRTRAAEQVLGLQRKLNELHGTLIAKMKEFNENRETQMSLKPEIEALLILLEEEEKKHLGISSTTTGGSHNVNVSMSYKSTTPNLTDHKSNACLTSYGSQPAGYVGGTLYSAGATGYAPGPPKYTDYSFAASRDPVPAPKPVLPPRPLSPPPVPAFQDRPEALNQVHSDMAKLKVLEMAVQDAAGQVEYPYDFRVQAVGPVRARSAPAEDQENYKERPTSSTSHDFTTATSSYTDGIRILEIHPKGKYIRLENVNKDKEYEIGEYMVQQNVGGHTVAVYRLPRRTKFAPNSTVTIWSGMNDPIMHQPPSDFVFQEQQRWGTGPECTTILSKPNGQAVSWMTAAHRFVKDAFEANSAMSSGGDVHADDEEMTELPVEQKQDHVYLRREKMDPPSLAANRHPHGLDTGNQSHPSTGQPRPLNYGNDNSTFSRQTRSQTCRPDPVPGQPYAGAAGQRMGSAPLRKYMATNTTLRGNGALANTAEVNLRCSAPTPSSFMKPSNKFYHGKCQVASMHDRDHQAPMPRPPLISQW